MGRAALHDINNDHNDNHNDYNTRFDYNNDYNTRTDYNYNDNDYNTRTHNSRHPNSSADENDFLRPLERHLCSFVSPPHAPLARDTAVRPDQVPVGLSGFQQPTNFRIGPDRNFVNH